MNLQDIQDRNYDAQLRRGKITNESTVSDCIDDLAGEVLELDDETPGTDNFVMEAADVFLNLLSVVKKAGINAPYFELMILQKLKYNETRED